MIKLKEFKRPRVLLVTRCIIKNNKGQILVAKRTSRKKFSGGLWEFPGGKLNKKENIEASMKKEIFEETRLKINQISKLFHITSRVISDKKAYHGFPYISMTGTAKLSNGKVKLSKEHDDFKWIKPKDINKLDCSKETKEAVKELLN